MVDGLTTYAANGPFLALHQFNPHSKIHAVLHVCSWMLHDAMCMDNDGRCRSAAKGNMESVCHACTHDVASGAAGYTEWWHSQKL